MCLILNHFQENICETAQIKLTAILQYNLHMDYWPTTIQISDIIYSFPTSQIVLFFCPLTDL